MSRITGIFSNAAKRVFSNFRGDFFGGITAGVVALPLALAFGVASGAGAAAGLYGAILVGLFASVFGGTKPQISGPTGPMTVVMAAIIAANPGNLKVVFTTIILAGLFQIIFGMLKTGNMIKYVPYPVISGFMSGIGVIIIILQINPLLGLDSEGTPLKTLMGLNGSISAFQGQSLILGLLTLLIMFFTPQKISQKVPPALLSLVSVTIISILLGFDVKVIGAIPTGLPAMSLPLIPVEDFAKIVPFAITLGLLGSVDSLLTSLVVDSTTKTNHDSNKELIGQGIGNVLAGLFGGIAGAGATMRTLVNIKSGGKTPLSGVIHAFFLVMILLGAAPLASKVPMSVLAGILIKVGIDIIDYKFLKIVNRAPRYDIAVMALVFVLTVFNDLIFAVGAGIVLSCILFTYYTSRQFNIETVDIKIFPYGETPEDRAKLLKHTLRMINFSGAVFFGSSFKILKKINELPETEYLIINLEEVHNMDISAVFVFEDIISILREKNVNLIMIFSTAEDYEKLSKTGVLSFNPENIFYDKSLAIEKARQIILEEISREGSAAEAQEVVNVA